MDKQFLLQRVLHPMQASQKVMGKGSVYEITGLSQEPFSSWPLVIINYKSNYAQRSCICMVNLYIVRINGSINGYALESITQLQSPGVSYSPKVIVLLLLTLCSRSPWSQSNINSSLQLFRTHLKLSYFNCSHYVLVLVHHELRWSVFASRTSVRIH